MSLRTLSLLPLLLLSACAPQQAEAVQETLASEPIFRYVDLGPLGRLELAEPFRDRTRLAVLEAPNTYRLRDEAFGGAESIVVVTDTHGLIRRISFVYGPGYDYEEKLSAYTETLGTPRSTTEAGAVWNDGETEFSLARHAGASYAAKAEMRDVTASR